MIRKDGTLEAVILHKHSDGDLTGCSHRFDDDEWWVWHKLTRPFDGAYEGLEWKSHPDPDAAWARFVAAQLMGHVPDE